MNEFLPTRWPRTYQPTRRGPIQISIELGALLIRGGHKTCNDVQARVPAFARRAGEPGFSTEPCAAMPDLHGDWHRFYVEVMRIVAKRFIEFANERGDGCQCWTNLATETNRAMEITGRIAR